MRMAAELRWMVHRAQTCTAEALRSWLLVAMVWPLCSPVARVLMATSMKRVITLAMESEARRAVMEVCMVGSGEG